MLMLQRSWSADEELGALREVSQRTNVKLRDVALVLVATGGRTELTMPEDIVYRVRVEVRRMILSRAFER
ncbi:ANTAR domain-containing protein [Amycolatopsis sp. FDAARGOS 1241]|uniref:ANTAR domain-containing protein n=1 Tax=Amycolatopsis sp. FDAARGOS 1241 TaxID=2778070 RepID=UPI00195075C4|nr:ANTAR domain-containing protein [Amycolatopsis sp. FDAARGOS 1241]QRP48236.1 ANTAR domain-containing protein [Amycolatopsis sp. FDAARGOS 1241]